MLSEAKLRDELLQGYKVHGIVYFFFSRGLQDVFDLWAHPLFYFGVSVKWINKIHRPLQLYRDQRSLLSNICSALQFPVQSSSEHVRTNSPSITNVYILKYVKTKE